MEALDELNDKQYAKVFRAITKFAMDGEEPELIGVEKVIFSLIKPQLVANQKRYDNGCKGGRKPNDNQNETETKPNDNQTETKCEPNDNVNVNVNDNVNDNYLKESKKEDKYKETNNVCASYEEIMKDYKVGALLKSTLWEFIRHCQLNGRTLTNDKLEDIIIELDKYMNDVDRISVVRKAISGGYFDVKRGW